MGKYSESRRRKHGLWRSRSFPSLSRLLYTVLAHWTGACASLTSNCMSWLPVSSIFLMIKYCLLYLLQQDNASHTVHQPEELRQQKEAHHRQSHPDKQAGCLLLSIRMLSHCGGKTRQRLEELPNLRNYFKDGNRDNKDQFKRTERRERKMFLHKLPSVTYSICYLFLHEC